MIPLTDNPVTRLEDDAFGFAPHVEGLHQAVAAAEPLPLTVGVFGGWGSGKSSFLSMWRGLLAESPTTRTVWFNPWKYDQKVEVWAALLHTVLAEIGRADALRDKAVRLARAATWLSLRAGLGHAVSLATAGVAGKSQVDALLDTVSRDDAEEYRRINAFEHDFADAVEQVVGSTGRLVVFVDDLDRCSPDAAVTVLESLKLFLGHARCVFVLAMDVDVLAAVTAHRFGAALAGSSGASGPGPAGVGPGLGGEAAGRRYLEKLVQLPFHLPAVGAETLRSVLAPHVGGLGQSEAFWELIEAGLGTNPRRVKRFVNVFNLALAVLEGPAGRSGDTRLKREELVGRLQLAKLLIIRGEHPDFFARLAREPEIWAAAERGENLDTVPDREELRRLLALSPLRGTYHDHPAAPDAAAVRRMIGALPPAWEPA